jgi:vacuolar-type H+-ATPase subunit I/STV1
MKADKQFYDYLRFDVATGGLVDPSPIIDSPSSNLISDNITEADKQFQTKQQDEDVLKLEEKIEGLQSQVELLEKRNQELTERNKELEAIAFPDYSDVVISDEEQEEFNKLSEEMENALTEQYRRGYISLKDIVKWGNDGTANVSEARLIKEMIRDIMPRMTAEERELVKNIGSVYKQPVPPSQIHVDGDYVLQKEVQNEVQSVASGGTGVNITKENG